MQTVKIPDTLTLARCEFAAEQPDAGQPGRKSPCRMTARSGQPIAVPGIGQVVHDLAGMRTPAARINVDYCHDQQQLLGYAEDIDTSSGDLTCTATLFSISDDDRAAEVIARGQAGQPYQCSIKWDDGTLEAVPEGQQTACNGRQIAGPAIIVRNWTLRGIAVCPYGMDPHTSAEFTLAKEFHMPCDPNADPNKSTPTEQQEAPVTTTTPPPAEASDDEQQPAAEVRAEMTAELQHYVELFGGELGAKWFAAGKSVEACYGEYVAALQTKHAAELAAAKTKCDQLQAGIAELTARLESLGAVGAAKDPVSGSQAADPAPGAKASGEYSTVLPDRLARVAAGMKMPSRN